MTQDNKKIAHNLGKQHRVFVCPRCTVIRLSEGDECPACGFEGKPDWIVLNEFSELEEDA